MKKQLWQVLASGAALSGLVVGGSAQALMVDISTSYPFSVRVGASGFPALGGQLSAGVGLAGLDTGYSRIVSLPPLGMFSAHTQWQVAWKGGMRLTSQVSGTVGPVALNLGGAMFSTPATTFDPLAGWTAEATDIRTSGWNAALSGRYRLSRTVIGVLGAELGPQANVYAGAELRRDLARTLPPAEGDDPTAPPETEHTGTLTYRAGMRAGKNVLGLTAGASYAAESGVTYALDMQVGPQRGGHSGLGLLASASWPERLGEGSLLTAYAAYEPWRETANTLRFGLEATQPLGDGTLKLDLRGGQSAGGVTGFGVGVRYSLALGDK